MMELRIEVQLYNNLLVSMSVGKIKSVVESKFQKNSTTRLSSKKNCVSELIDGEIKASSKVRLDISKLDTSQSSSYQIQLSPSNLDEMKAQKSMTQESTSHNVQRQKRQKNLTKKKLIKKSKIKMDFKKLIKKDLVLEDKETIRQHKLNFQTKNPYYKKNQKPLKKKNRIQILTLKPDVERVMMPLKKPSIEDKIDFSQLADVKPINIDRKFLQRKKQDLLKRAVQDWSATQKNRSQRRQLRALPV